MRTRDLSSDVCSSDLAVEIRQRVAGGLARVDIVVVPVAVEEGAPRYLRALGGCVGGGILEAAVVCPQRLLRDQLGAEHQVEVVVRKAGGKVQLGRRAAAAGGVAIAQVDGGAVGMILQNEVDHAGNRVQAVHCRGAEDRK